MARRPKHKDEDSHQGASTAARWEPPHHLGLRKRTYFVDGGLKVSGYEVLGTGSTLSIDKRAKGQWIVTQSLTGVACARKTSLVKAVEWARRVYSQHWLDWHAADPDVLRSFLKRTSPL